MQAGKQHEALLLILLNHVVDYNYYGTSFKQKKDQQILKATARL